MNFREWVQFQFGFAARTSPARPGWGAVSWTSLAIAFSTGLAWAEPQSPQVESADATGVRIRYSGPAPQRASVLLGDEAYPALTLPDMGHLVDAGQPILPRRRVLVEIPPGVDVDLVTTVLSEVAEEAAWLGPAPRAGVDPVSGERAWTPVPYASEPLLPLELARIEYVGWLRHRRVACVALTPVRFEPRTGVAHVAHELTLELRFKPARDATEAMRSSVRDAGFFRSMYGRLLLNPGTYYGPGGALTVPPPSAATSTGAAASAGSNLSAIRWRLKVEADELGLYAITPADLLAAGIDPTSVDPRRMGMSHAGASIAVLVEGEADGAFDPADRLLFYAEPEETVYTATDAWWLFEALEGLGAGPTRVLRMATSDGTPQMGDVPVPFFRETVHIEESHRYYQFMPIGPSDDHWMWERLDGPGFSDHTIVLPDPVPAGSNIRVRAALHGFTGIAAVNPDHHTRILLNGTQVKEAFWDGIVPFLHDADASSSLLLPGNNTIRFEQIADTGAVVDFVYSNWFEVDYDRHFRAVADELAWTNDGGQLATYAVEGLASSNEYSLVVTDTGRVERVLNVQIDNPGGGLRATFRHNPTATERYFLATDAAVKTPLSVAPGSPSILVPAAGADLLIVAEAQFASALAPLIQHREQAGLRVAMVTPQQIYDDYGHGVFSPPAIQAFVRDAFESWAAPAPSFVLMVGEASFDFKDDFGLGPINSAPGVMHQTLSQGTVPTDHLYVLAAGDDPLPELFIGRLPAANPADAALLVTKILDYETATPPGAWRTEVLHIADFGAEFSNTLDFAAGHVPGTHTVTEVYADAIGSSGAVHSAIMAEFGQGAVLGTYLGHGAILNWGSGLLSQGDPAGMGNGAKLPLVSALNCVNGFFAAPSPLRSLGEEFVLAPGGGAMSCVTTSGLGALWELRAILLRLYDHVFAGESLGAVHTGSKVEAYLIDSVNEDNLWDIILFGDPAGELFLP